MNTEAPLETVELEPPGGAPNASVIWLHGLGADGTDFVPIVPALTLPAGARVRFVFPHAPLRPVTLNQGFVMRAWFDIFDLEDFERRYDADGIRQAHAQIEALLARERARGIGPERTVLGGFSQGGALALHVGLRHAATLAGLFGLSTFLMRQDELDALADAGAANRRTPVFLGHGSADPVVPLPLGAGSQEALTRRGYDVTWHAYPMQHEVCPQEIADLSTWFARVLATPSATP